MADRKRYHSGRLVEIPAWLPKAMRRYRDVNNLSVLDVAMRIPVDAKGVRIGQHSIGSLMNHDRKPEQRRIGSILLSHIVNMIESDTKSKDWLPPTKGGLGYGFVPEESVADHLEYERNIKKRNEFLATTKAWKMETGQINFNGSDKKKDRSVAKLQLSIANLNKSDLELVWSIVDRLAEIDPRQKDVANKLLDLATMLEENGTRQEV